MGWPQTVHVPSVLHAVASCALGTATSMKGAGKKLKICFSPWMTEGAKDSPLLQEVGGGHKQYTCSPNL